MNMKRYFKDTNDVFFFVSIILICGFIVFGVIEAGSYIASKKDISGKIDQIEMGFSPEQVEAVFDREPDVQIEFRNSTVWYYWINSDSERDQFTKPDFTKVENLNDLPFYYASAKLVFNNDSNGVVLKHYMGEGYIQTESGQYPDGLPAKIVDEVFGSADH